MEIENLTEGMKALALTELENDLHELIRSCSLENPYTEEHRNLTRICQLDKYLPEYGEFLKIRATDKTVHELNAAEIDSWKRHASTKVRNGLIK